MKWYNVSESARYGVAIYNFSHENPCMLPLNVGDSVLLLKESDEWFYGSYARNRSKAGVFPRSFVCVRDAIVDRSGLNEIILPHEPPIVQEISSVLREWWIIWKQLYVLNSTHFESVRNMMYELIDWRKSIMSGTLPADELKEVKQKVTAKIDVGNHILGLDLVVRDEHGNILNPEMTSTVDMYRAHKIAATQIETMNNIDYRSQKSLSHYCHNLFVTVKNFVCRVGDDADLLMTLYDAKEGVFISENYLVKWGKGGLVKDMDQLNNLRVLFTDLGSKDLNREKVFLVCQIIRIGSMELKEVEHRKSNIDRKSSMGGGKRLGEGVRRPFGVAAMDISDIVTGKLESDEEKQYFVPFVQCGDHDFLDSVIRKILTAKEVSQKDHKGQGLWCSLKLLHGDIKQVREENPHLVSTSTSVARKMGFPEVILPGDVRNDLYLTLVQGEFPRGTISMERNIEVTVKVCNEKGQLIPGVISYGSGCDPMKEYRSMIYYHEDKPKWMETFKVAIPIEEFYNSHLKFTFRHRSSNEAKDKAEKIFALSFVKLMQKNGTTLKDESHDLLVFKVDHKKYDDTDTSYLNLPSTRSDLESYALNTKLVSNGLSFSLKDSFSISTLVCSTKLTQNVDLLGLLKWWANPENLESNLKALMKVDGEEVVKFLQDTLDALFDILMKNPDSELYDNLVVDALVFIIGLISDRKYHHFRPVLDVYIMENFCATLAYTKLMVVLKYYVDNANDPDEAFHDKLLKTMKSIEYLFKFIVRSRQLFSEINSGKGKQQFENTFQRLLESLSSMMLYDSHLTLVIQGACLKYFPCAILDILTVFDGPLLCNILVEMITNVPSDRLTKQKMTCVNDIVHSALFQLPECRAILLPLVNFQLKQLLERNEEMELCVKILSDMLAVLHHQNSSATKDDFTEINNTILRTVIQTVIAMNRDRSLVGNMVAIMIDIFRKMTPYHYNQYVGSFPLPSDLLDFLMEILLVFRDLVSKNVYQKDWCEMIMLQNSVILKSLRYFSHTIRDHFTSPFEYQVWNNFFHCAISFLTQDPLQLENFSQNKRNKIIARYKDMRRETGFEIRSLWFNLGQNKIRFVPEMVGPFLEMTLIPEIELRKATIPIFFDMMQCEFYSPRQHGVSLYEEFFAQNHDIKGSFKDFEDEMITQLDMLVEGGRGDEQYKELFLEILSSLCENHATMNEKGMHFVQTAVRLMRRLLEYRVIVMDENKESRMSCTVNLLEFYNEINRKEMYIRYLYKLCLLHLESDNFVEAAYSLMLHTRLLHWSDEPVPQPLKNDKYPHCETQRELKEKLYYDIIDYFDKGKLWETGLSLCKELAIQLENEVFDYIQLGDLLKRMAVFYDNIMSKVRPEPEYFRVGYFGQGFPTFLRNKIFVYRGKEYERLNDFQGRLLNQFPKAQLLTKLSPPSQEITESTGQFLQINKVDAVMKENEKFKSKTVHDQILKYYRVNEVQNFVYSRPIRKGEKDSDNEFATMWIERTSLETRYPLPGILRWFNVTSVKVTELSPLENAIEAMEVSNLKIKESIIQHRSDPALPSNPLCMLLSGIVDAAVMGGIVNYEKAFFNEEYLKLNNSPKDIEGVEKLKDLIASQIPLLEVAIAIHRTKAHPSLKPLQEHLEQSFAKLKKNVEEKYGEKEAPKEILERQHVSIRRVKPTQNASHSSAPIPPERISSTTLSIADLTRRTASLTGGSISPTKLTQSVRAQSVWVKPTTTVPFKSNGTKKRDSGTLRRSSASVTSQTSSNPQLQHQTSESSTLWYDTVNKPESPRIELSEEVERFNEEKTNQRLSPSTLICSQLTAARPRRSEVEKRYSRPSSEHFRRRSTPSPTRHSRTLSNVSLSNPSTPCVEDDNDDKPPPLPQKQAYADYSNITDEMQLSGFNNRKSSLSLPTRIKNRPPPPLPVRDNSPLNSPTLRRQLPVPTSDTAEIPPELPKKPHRMLLDSQSQGS